MTEGFGTRLEATIARRGRLTVGIDPHPHLLAAFGLPDTAASLRQFSSWLIEAATGRAGIVKVQVAFFERLGSAGFAALEEVLAAARAAGLLVIADAKRGDIGSTMAGYAATWLDPASPLAADAVTLSPYLGMGSLEPAFERADEFGRGVFVLSATSNPEAASLQTARTESGDTVAAAVARDAERRNAARGGGLGAIGIVVGATVDRAFLGLDLDEAPRVAVLAPGFGAQGVAAGDADRVFGAAAPRTLVAMSRSLVADHDPDLIAAAIDRSVIEVGGSPVGADS